MIDPSVSGCPIDHGGDDRKSAHVAYGGAAALTLGGFADARAILRNPDARQAGFLAHLVGRARLLRPPILYLHGAAHRAQRGATARFFAPRTVTTRYRQLMSETADGLLAGLQRSGTAELDTLSLDMAVTVASEIVGLTESNRAAMAARLSALASGVAAEGARLRQWAGFVRAHFLTLLFLHGDVKPAIRARRRQRRDDVISHLIEEGYSDSEILTECIVYGAAGMITTREFITMAAWHLFDSDDLRIRFLGGEEEERIAILEEILRLEPIVGTLYRRFDAVLPATGDRAALPAGAVVALDIRGANGDVATAGACPHRLDPDRKPAQKGGGAGLAFGDGEHRCPGAQVAMLESAIFLDKLFRIPGIRLTRAPDIGWNALIAGYELRGAALACTVQA